MKTLKKLLSTLLASAMTVSCFASAVMAEETTPTYSDTYSDYLDNGWTASYGERIQSDTEFICVTDERAKSGDYSLLIYDGLTGASKPLSVTHDSFSTPAGDYTLSIWIAGAACNLNWRTMFTMAKGVVFEGTEVPQQVNITNGTLVQTVGEWKNYTFNLSIAEDISNNTLTLMRQGAGTGYVGTYLDDISLINKATGKEILTNGSFDDDGKLKYSTEKEAYGYGWAYDYAGAEQTDDVFMCVTDLMAYNGSNSMLIHNSLAYGSTKPTRITQSGISTPKGEYKFSVWIAGVTTNYGTMVKLSKGGQINKKEGLVAGETVNGWTNYTYTFTVEEDTANNILYIMQQGGSTGTFIDNVSLTDADGNEYILNGGFEDDGAIEYTSAYEEYLNGWTVGYDDGTQSDDVFVCVTDDKANNGNHSVLIRNTIANKDGAPAIGISQSGFQAPAGDYTFSFWLSGEYSGWKTMVSLSGEKHVGCNLDGCTLVDTAGRWSKYEYTFTVPEGYTNHTINIIREGDSAGMYIDDISLTDANGNELIANGGFEIKGNLDEIINPVAYPTSEGNAITLSWKNPPKAYDEIKIYFDGELQTGVEVEEISTAANAFNQFYYSGIENYTEYTVKVEALRGGEIVSSVELPVWTDDLGPTTNYAGNQLIDPWKYTRMENTEYGYANTVASVDYDEKASGSSSMKLTGNIEKVKHQCYPNINQQVTLDQGVKYVLSFKAKLNNVGALFVVLETEDLGEKIWGRTQLLNNFTTSDWKTYTVPLVFENENGDTTFDSMNEGEMYSATIMIAVEKMIGSINIDDVKLYAVEEDDDTYTPINAGENLIKNGGFEFGGYAVEDAKFEVSNGSKFVAIDKIQSGDIKVTTGIRNISMGEDFGAATIIAVYNNGQLVSIPYILEREYVESSVYLPTDKYSATVTIPEMTQDDKYEIKVMYWDGFSAMKSLDTADCLK